MRARSISSTGYHSFPLTSRHPGTSSSPPKPKQREFDFASKGGLSAPERHFRSAPNNGHREAGSAGPFRAKNGLRGTKLNNGSSDACLQS